MLSISGRAEQTSSVGPQSHTRSLLFRDGSMKMCTKDRKIRVRRNVDWD